MGVARPIAAKRGGKRGALDNALVQAFAVLFIILVFCYVLFPSGLLLGFLRHCTRHQRDVVRTPAPTFRHIL